jgi:hypothetical protein
MERQLRRAFTQEQHARNLERYDAASQPRPGTAATGRTRPATAHSRPSTGYRPIPRACARALGAIHTRARARLPSRRSSVAPLTPRGAGSRSRPGPGA